MTSVWNYATLNPRRHFGGLLRRASVAKDWRHFILPHLSLVFSYCNGLDEL